jgi:hypothetical protein
MVCKTITRKPGWPKDARRWCSFTRKFYEYETDGSNCSDCRLIAPARKAKKGGGA